MSKGRVAVLRVEPDSVLGSIERLCELAGMSASLDPGATTILKDNISWHFPFPAANTTPWQLEGTILALRGAGFGELSCVQNKTVVTDAFKGEDLNHYLPILSRYGVPVLYNFRESDMKWIVHRPKARMHVLADIYPDGFRIPDYFYGKNIVHLPTVKCVAGETTIILGDGTSTTIEELFASQMGSARAAQVDSDGSVHLECRIRVMAMTPSGAVKSLQATMISKSPRRERALAKVTTRSGRTLVATLDHRVFTPEGWVALRELGSGSRIGLARRVRVDATCQPLPDVIEAAEPVRVMAVSGRKYDQTFSQSLIDGYVAGSTVTTLAAASGVRWQVVQSILKRHRVPLRRNIKRIRTPKTTSPGFWRWLGYVMAEGCIERTGSINKLWWINSTPEIREDFFELTKQLFGVKATEHSTNKGVHIYSRDLARFFESLGLPVPLRASNKVVPATLFRCGDEEIAAFLSGYIDGDGCVSARQAQISTTTKSLALARGIQDLYARLGSVAFLKPIRVKLPNWDEARTYYTVTVSGVSFLPLAEHLRFRHPGKQSRFESQLERLAASKQPSNWDTVPLPADEYRRLRTSLGLSSSSVGMPSAVNALENGSGSPTPRITRQLIAALEDRSADPEIVGRIDRLRALASEDLAWDHVVSIEEIPSTEDDVYDLTVPEGSSFVGNGFILHNCHIYTTTTGAMKNAFGGLLHTHRHYTHSWIHRTLVDLLAIQKEIHTGLFAVMDGTTAGDGPGPRTMRPVVKNVMLASSDQVAIDAVAAKMMGFDPLSLEYIRVAHEDGLGVGDPRDIEVVGDDVSKESWGFRVGDNGASVVGDLLWFSPLKRFQKLFFRTPLVNVFIMGSETYHDYYRWPLKDRAVFDKWRRETGWGKLFDTYAKGPIAPTRGPETASVRPATTPGS